MKNNIQNKIDNITNYLKANKKIATGAALVLLIVLGLGALLDDGGRGRGHERGGDRNESMREGRGNDFNRQNMGVGEMNAYMQNENGEMSSRGDKDGGEKNKGDYKNNQKENQSPFEIWLDAQEVKFDSFIKSIVGEKAYTFFSKPETVEKMSLKDEMTNDNDTETNDDNVVGATTTQVILNATGTASGTLQK